MPSVPARLDRIERPSPALFRRAYADRGRPVIITGAMDGWPARRVWSAAYFARVAGSRIVPVSFSPDGVFRGDPDNGFAGTYRDLSVSDAVHRILSGLPESERLYIAQVDLPKSLPELVADIAIPSLVDVKMLSAMNLWLGPSGCISPLHYDAADALLAQVFGRKRVLLYGPEDTKNLYPYPAVSRIPHCSRVDPSRNDDPRFPRLSRARPREDVLGPGEMLFLPARTWHHVTSLELSASVNFWWRPRWHLHLRLAMLRLLPLRLLSRLRAGSGHSLRSGQIAGTRHGPPGGFSP